MQRKPKKRSKAERVARRAAVRAEWKAQHGREPLPKPKPEPAYHAGRHPECDEAIRDKVAYYLGLGLPPEMAADAVGVSHETVRLWRVNPDPFFAPLREAKARRAAALAEQAVSRESHAARNAQWWLERVAPFHFSLAPARFAAVQAESTEKVAVDLTVEGRDAT